MSKGEIFNLMDFQFSCYVTTSLCDQKGTFIQRAQPFQD